jgi:hypothetical protein
MDKTAIILLALVVFFILIDKLLQEGIYKSIVNVKKNNNVIKIIFLSFLGSIISPIILFAIEFLLFWDEPLQFYIDLKLEYSKPWIAIYSFLGFVSSILLLLIGNKVKRKDFGKKLIDDARNSKKKKNIIFRILFIVILSSVSYFFITHEGMKLTKMFEYNSPIEKVKKRLSSFKNNRPSSDYFKVVTPLFEEYYDCLECVEYISHFNLDEELNDEYARYKIPHFSRAIELGSKDLYVYIQDLRYKFFVKDKFGAEQRNDQIQEFLENFEEEALRPFYYDIGAYYFILAYQTISKAIDDLDRKLSLDKKEARDYYDLYNVEMARGNSYEKLAFQYIRKGINKDMNNSSANLKENVLRITNDLANYYSSIRKVLISYQRVSLSWIDYVNNRFSDEDRRERCLIMSDLGSLGGEKIYEWMKPICSKIQIRIR